MPGALIGGELRAPTVVMQPERKLRLYSGLKEPALHEWIEEARDCISTHHLEGEAAVSLLVSYLDGAARSEIRCQPNDVRKDANNIIGALEDVYGKRRLRTNCCNDFSSVDRWLACPSLRIHTGWLRSPGAQNRQERNMMFRDQFVGTHISDGN